MHTALKLKKNLGQHFLRDTAVTQKICSSMNIQQGDWLLEIGPGDGKLTQHLVNSNADKLTAVEIDRRFAEKLQIRFNNNDRIKIICGDFLKEAPSIIKGVNQKIRVVGNLPYYITTPILFLLLKYRSQIIDSTVTIQKEVAERIISSPHSKKYGIPSIMFQLYSQVEILFNISRNSFYPVPDVDSSVLKIKYLKEPIYPLENENFFRIILKIIFNKRRKMLRNTLKQIIPDNANSAEIPIDLSKRPEDLTVKQLTVLSNILYRLKSKAN